MECELAGRKNEWFIILKNSCDDDFVARVFLFAVLNFQTSESESLTESAGFCAIPERTANLRWQLHFRLRKWDKEQQDFVLLSIYTP